jgi:putative flavoprotein involved in K+ transport
MAAAKPTSNPSSPCAPVLIVGAGPAGLALARELMKRRVQFAVLERGDNAGESWRRMPNNLHLVSPWKTNALPGPFQRRFARHRSVSRLEFAAYLADYAEGLPVRYGTEIHSVAENPEGGFILQTSRGEYRPARLVNATGYYSNPHVPEITGARDSEIPRLHFAHYRSSSQVRELSGKDDARVLVVGQRLSAGQIIRELKADGHQLSLSHRGPLRFGAGPAGWWIFYRVFSWLEWAKLRLHGNRTRAVEVRMPGGDLKRWIRSGQVRCFPEIKRFERNMVQFVDGAILQPDLVIYATGFRPALHHLRSLPLTLPAETGRPALRDHFESADMPDLFFLGLDQQRNFRSRFLRGIREDAVRLAELLQRRCEEAPSASRSINRDHGRFDATEPRRESVVSR